MELVLQESHLLGSTFTFVELIMRGVWILKAVFKFLKSNNPVCKVLQIILWKV